MDVADITVETFTGREGQAFTIQFADAKLELTLAEVAAAPGEWGSAQREQFSIVLHGPLEHLLPQQTWPLDHEELGRTEIFLVPLGPEGGAARYQAVFS